MSGFAMKSSGRHEYHPLEQRPFLTAHCDNQLQCSSTDNLVETQDTARVISLCAIRECCFKGQTTKTRSGVHWKRLHLPVSAILIMISGVVGTEVLGWGDAGTGGVRASTSDVVGDRDTDTLDLDPCMEKLDPEPPRHGLQSMFMSASSMAAVDLLKDARADLHSAPLWSSCAADALIEEDDAAVTTLNDARRTPSTFSSSIFYSRKLLNLLLLFVENCSFQEQMLFFAVTSESSSVIRLLCFNLRSRLQTTG